MFLCEMSVVYLLKIFSSGLIAGMIHVSCVFFKALNYKNSCIKRADLIESNICGKRRVISACPNDV